MLKAVFKVQLRALMRSMAMRGTSGKRKNRKLASVAFALLMVYALGTLLVSFGTVFYSLCEAYASAGLSWLYFAMAAILAIGLSVIASVFMSQSLLFEAQDNDLLLSLPIRPSVILGARICVLLLLEYLLSFFIIGLAGGIYAYLFSPSWLFYLCLFIGWLLLPLLSTAISCLLGYITSFVSSRLRNKSFFVVAVSLLLLGGYMYGINALFLNVNLMVASGGEIASTVERFLPPFYYFGSLLAMQDLLSFAMLALWSLVPFGVLYWLLSKSFIRLATTKVSLKRRVYNEKAVKVGSAFSAMLKKEISKFLCTPMYLLNTGLSFLANLLFGVYFVISGPDLLTEMLSVMPESGNYAVPMVIAILCAIATLSFTTAPSISLEGRKLWILKSSPIAARDVFFAKISLNLIFAYPTQIFAVLCSIYVLRPGFVDCLLLFLLPMLIQLFVAVAGLLCNLFFPKFDFTNEVMVIKQSASVFVAMLVSFAAVSVCILPYVLWLSSMIPFVYYGLLVCVFLLILNVFTFLFLMRRGVQLYDSF